jgi:hypothetical protein
MAASEGKDLSSDQPAMTATDEVSTAIEFIEHPNSMDLQLCASCVQAFHGFYPGPKVRMIEIARLEEGWIAHGRIEETYCETCHHVYDALVLYIPIVCATFPCPTCGPGSKLTPHIQDIQRVDSSYEFTALLRCTKCSKVRRISKLLRGLPKISRLKVGPTGVEIEIKGLAPRAPSPGLPRRSPSGRRGTAVPT